MNYPSIYAEVPFMLKIDAEAASIFLEGEIDGLALNNSRGENKALFIDYKTGGNSQESDQELHNKHLLQAQCYSLALLNQGFSEVEANFIRVEQASAEDPAQPQIVRYQFCEQNRKELEAAILAAYKKREA
jgi:RecB family exonuclease